jgi:hypothetical protein
MSTADEDAVELEDVKFAMAKELCEPMDAVRGLEKGRVKGEEEVGWMGEVVLLVMSVSDLAERKD